MGDDTPLQTMNIFLTVTENIETRVSQAQPTFIRSNSAIVTVESNEHIFKVNKRSTRHCSGVFIVNFTYI